MVIAVTAGISQLKPAIPVVDRDSVRVGTIERGTLLIEVRGHGSLVPEEITWVTARVGGRVVRVPVEPGIEVKPDTVLVELADPDLERAVSEAQRSLASAEAELQRSRILLDQQVLDLKAATAQAKASFEEAKNQSEMEEELAKRGLIAARQRRLSRDRAERSRMLLEIQVQRVKNSVKTNEIQLGEKSAAVKRAKEVLQHARDERNALTVVAGVDGILQHLGPAQDARLEVGQRVGNGTILAKITNPKRLGGRAQSPRDRGARRRARSKGLHRYAIGDHSGARNPH